MRNTGAVLVALLTLAAGPLAGSTQPAEGLATVLSRAVRYVQAYEHAFSILASEELYVQEMQAPENPGGNLTTTNPGGGMQRRKSNRSVLRSDYLLVQLGVGAGWLPARDVFEAQGAKVRERDDRLVRMFTTGDVQAFDAAMHITSESAKYNLGPVTRSINIPTLVLMFLHPSKSERFAFADEGESMIGARLARRVSFKEMARPTLIKTTAGRDLALTGHVWFDQSNGAVLKTDLSAVDQDVRASVTVTFKPDVALDIWVPDQMIEYYKAARSVDEVVATATYSNIRRVSARVEP